MSWIKISFIYSLIFSMFYFYFISPIKIEILHANVTEKQLKQELSKKQKSEVNKRNAYKNIVATPLSKEALIIYFMNKIMMHEFLIEEISPIQIKKHENLIKISFKVILLGDIFQLKKLIDQLYEDKFLMHIDEILMNKKKYILKIDVFNVNVEDQYVFKK